MNISTPVYPLFYDFPMWLICYGVLPKTHELAIRYKEGQVQVSLYVKKTGKIGHWVQQRYECGRISNEYMQSVVSDGMDLNEFIYQKLIENVDPNYVGHLNRLKDMLRDFNSAEAKTEEL